MDNHNDTSTGERQLIRTLSPWLGRPGGPGLPQPGDDLAALGPDVSDLLWSADMLMDGVDFRGREQDWGTIGGKALRVNLSDCAACGTIPVGCLLSLSVCNDLAYDQVLALVQGVVDVGKRYDCPLMGGDTNSWEAPTVINVTIAARPCSSGAVLLRSGARAGDLLCLTGAIGGSLLGRHLDFEPRLAVGQELARLPAHAAIDISDGLAIDTWHLCDASGVGARIDGRALDRLTHEDAHRRAMQTRWTAREHALFDGEDFELIVAIPPETSPARIEDLGLSVLGHFTAETGVFLVDGEQSSPIPRRGWEHMT